MIRIVSIALLLMFGSTPLATAAESVKPPLAKKIPLEIVTHADKRVDDYFWLRQKTNPAVTAYLDAENAYTDATMAPTKGFQEKLYREILGHVKETDSFAPLRRGKYFYYSRTEAGKSFRPMLITFAYAWPARYPPAARPAC